MLALTDFIAPVVPVGLFFGRIGNFINAELWGRPSDVYSYKLRKIIKDNIA
jgi:phosphatidylglycerol:prolipoprotein diacylglycerol transferase